MTKEAEKGGEYKVFAKHKFAGKGDVDPVVGVIQDAELVDGGESEGDIEKKAKIVVWVRSVEGNAAVPEDVPSEEKSLVSPVKEKADENSRVAEIAGTTSNEEAKKRVVEIAGTTSNEEAKKQNARISPVQAATSMNTILPHLRRLFAPREPVSEPVSEPSASQRGSLLDMDIEDNISLTLQPLSLPPTTPAVSIAPSAPNVPVKQPSSLPKPTTSSPQPLTETVQTTSEPSTRTYHHTMNLRAAPTSKGHWVGNTFVRAAPPSLLNTHFVTSLDVATAPILQALRGWRGSAKLEVKIGRIWIAHDALQISDTDARGGAGVVDRKRMARWLEGGRRADMTTLVTEEAGDVEAIVGMKLFEQDEKFWGKTPKWGIEYIFSCVDPREGGREGEEGKFTVTVDAETFRWKCETGERCLGETWVHCLKRVWDFKVCGTGRQEVEGEYKEWAEELVEGLYVP